MIFTSSILYLKNYVCQYCKLLFSTLKDNSGNRKINNPFSDLWKNLSQNRKDKRALFDWQEVRANATEQDFISYFQNASQAAREFAKAENLSDEAIKGFLKSQRQAIFDGSKLITTLKNLGTQLLAIGANMLIAFAVTKGVELLGNAWDAEVNKVEYAKKAIDEYKQKWSETIAETEKAKKVVKDYGKDFVDLSKGVNPVTGENIGLNEEEYERWLKANAAIAESTLATVDGVNVLYDEQGNAIVSLTDTIGTLEKAYQTLEIQAQQKILKDANESYTKVQTAYESNGFGAFWNGITNGNNYSASEGADWLRILDDLLKQKAENEWDDKRFTRQIQRAMGKNSIIDLNAALKLMGYTGDTDANQISKFILKNPSLVNTAQRNQQSNLEYVTSPLYDLAQAAFKQVFAGDDFNGLSAEAAQMIVNAISKMPSEQMLGYQNGNQLVDEMTKFAKMFVNGGDLQTSINAMQKSQSAFAKGEVTYGQLLASVPESFGDLPDVLAEALLESFGLNDSGFYKKIEKRIRGDEELNIQGLVSDVTDEWINGLNRAQLEYIAKLPSGAYTMGQIDSMYDNQLKVEKASVEALTDSYEALSKSQKSAADVMKDIGADGVMTIDQYKELIAANKEYANAVVSSNGIMRLDYDKVRQINQAQIQKQQQLVKEGLANNLTEQAKIQQEINELIAQGAEETSNEVNAKKEQLIVLEKQAAQYRAMASQYKYMTSSYKRWLDAKNAPDEAAGFKEGKNALDAIKQGQKTGRRNTELYKSAVEYIFGDRQFASDKEITKAVGEAQKIYNKDGSLNLNEWRRLSFKYGAQDNTGAWKVNSIEGYAKAMGWSKEFTAQAIMALNQYNGYQGISVPQELVKQAEGLLPKTEIQSNTEAQQENTRALQELNATMQNDEGDGAAQSGGGSNAEGAEQGLTPSAQQNEAAVEQPAQPDPVQIMVEAIVTKFTEKDAEVDLPTIQAASAVVTAYTQGEISEQDIKGLDVNGVTAFVSWYKQATSGADITNLKPEDIDAYVAAYYEQNGGASTTSLKPQVAKAIIKAYEANDNTTAAENPIVTALINRYKDQTPDNQKKIITGLIGYIGGYDSSKATPPDPVKITPEALTQLSTEDLVEGMVNGAVVVPVEPTAQKGKFNFWDWLFGRSNKQTMPEGSTRYFGNVATEYENRPHVIANGENIDKLRLWDDQIRRGDLSTHLTTTYTYGEGENTIAINVTPILPDGTVVTPEQLEAYIDGIVAESGGDITALLQLDKLSNDETGIAQVVEDIFVGSNAIKDAQTAAVKLHQQMEKAMQVFGDVPVYVGTEKAKKEIDNLKAEISKGATLPVGIRYINHDAGGGKVPLSGQNLLQPQLLATGTKDAKGGPSLVGEAGREIWVDSKSGNWQLIDQPRLLNLRKGDIVYNNKQTESLLNGKKKTGGKAFAGGLNGLIGLGIGGIIGLGNGNNGKPTSNPGKTPEQLLKEIEKLYDWIPTLLSNAQKMTQKLIKQVKDFVGHVAQNAQLEQALASTRTELDKNRQAYERYMQQANTVASQLGLSEDMVRKIQNGEIDIESLDDNTKKKIEAYKKWYDQAQAVSDTIEDLKEQEHELQLQRMDNIINDYNNRVDLVSDASDRIKDQIKVQQATGKQVNESSYMQLMYNEQEKLNLLQQERNKLLAEFDAQIVSGNLKEGSDEWHKYRNEIQNVDSAIADATIGVQEFKDEIVNLKIDRLQYAAAVFEQIQQSNENIMSLHDAQGTKNIDTYYKDLISNGDHQISNLEEQNRLLYEQLEGMDVESEKYQELMEKIRANDNSIMNVKISQEQWNDAIADLKIDALQKQREQLEKTNDEYQKQIEYEEALQALEKAKNQKNKLVYREGVGFVYEADQDAIDAAQKRVDDLDRQRQIDKIDQQIQDIENNKENDNVWNYEGSERVANNTNDDITVKAAPFIQESIEQPLNDFVDSIETISKQLSESMLYMNDMNLPDANEMNDLAAQMNDLVKVKEMMQIQIGDINLTGVDNTETLAKDIVQRLPNQILQEIYKKS